MSRGVRKLVLALHVATSVGLLGAVAAFLVLAIAGLVSPAPPLVRGAYLAMQPLAEFVIVPLAWTALLVGLVESLGTRWGVVRYYWVVAKLLLTILVIVVLLLQLDPIALMAELAGRAEISAADLQQLRISLIAHAGAGLLVLLLPLVLSIYKPRGRTGWGWYRQQSLAGR